MILNDETLEATKKDLAAYLEKQDELKEQHTEQQQRQTDIKNEIAELNKKIDELRMEGNQVHSAVVLLANEYNALNPLIQKLELSLANHETELSIQAELETMPDFYDALEQAIEAEQQSLLLEASPEEVFVDPATACEKIKERIESTAIGYELVSLRDVKTRYSNMMRKWAEMKHDNKKIPLSERKATNEYLRASVSQEPMASYWYTP